ncbi:Cyclin-A1-2 [Allomyces arbusculus]|nr:Cyclin-A1-2 [Allomyces arbusculus]
MFIKISKFFRPGSSNSNHTPHSSHGGAASPALTAATGVRSAVATPDLAPASTAAPASAPLTAPPPAATSKLSRTVTARTWSKTARSTSIRSTATSSESSSSTGTAPYPTTRGGKGTATTRKKLHARDVPPSPRANASSPLAAPFRHMFDAAPTKADKRPEPLRKDSGINMSALASALSAVGHGATTTMRRSRRAPNTNMLAQDGAASLLFAADSALVDDMSSTAASVSLSPSACSLGTDLDVHADHAAARKAAEIMGLDAPSCTTLGSVSEFESVNAAVESSSGEAAYWKDVQRVQEWAAHQHQHGVAHSARNSFQYPDSAYSSVSKNGKDAGAATALRGATVGSRIPSSLGPARGTQYQQQHQQHQHPQQHLQLQLQQHQHQQHHVPQTWSAATAAVVAPQLRSHASATPITSMTPGSASVATNTTAMALSGWLSTMAPLSGSIHHSLLPEGDQQLVPYVCGISGLLTSLEEQYPVCPDFMTRHPQLVPVMRDNLVDYMHAVGHDLAISMDAVFLAVYYLDRYLSVRCDASVPDLEMVCIVSLLVASKYEDIAPPSMADFAHLLNGVYKEPQLRDMEAHLLNALAFRLRGVTIASFLPNLARAAGLDIDIDLETSPPTHPIPATDLPQLRTAVIVRHLAAVAVTDYSLHVFRPSKLATATIVLAMQRAGWPVPWAALDAVVGHARRVIEPVVAALDVAARRPRVNLGNALRRHLGVLGVPLTDPAVPPMQELVPQPRAQQAAPATPAGNERGGVLPTPARSALSADGVNVDAVGDVGMAERAAVAVAAAVASSVFVG